MRRVARSKLANDGVRLKCQMDFHVKFYRTKRKETSARAHSRGDNVGASSVEKGRQIQVTVQMVLLKTRHANARKECVTLRRKRTWHRPSVAKANKGTDMMFKLAVLRRIPTRTTVLQNSLGVNRRKRMERIATSVKNTLVCFVYCLTVSSWYDKVFLNSQHGNPTISSSE